MDYLLHIVILALIYTILSLSLNLELGYAGLYNFGHVAFFGIGAYASALFTIAGYGPATGLLAALLTAGAAGALIAVPALRLTGDFFGIAMLSFAEMARLFFLNERWLTRGPMGIPGIPRPAWIGGGKAALPLFLLTAAVIAAAALLIFRRLETAPYGRALKVIREDEAVAESLGKNPFLLKIKCVVAGSAGAGVAGALWAHYVTYISPNDFTIQQTILILLCVVLGGKGTIFGPVLGAFAVIAFQESLRFLPIPADWGRLVAPLQGLVFGAGLMLLMLKRPQGMIAEHRSSTETPRETPEVPC
jgi:branched-chain amino acid transport system permease protein